jgi:MoxR-like ATPase
MREIVFTHFENIEENMLRNALEVFYSIRDKREIRKKPSTSEFIDWINALKFSGIAPDRIKETLPFMGVVLKKDEDLEVLKRNGI